MSKIRGFTLIELLITIAVVAILSGVGLAAFTGAQKTSRDGKRKADLESIRSALEIYRSDNGTYPAGTGVLSPTYIATVPTDPSTKLSYPYTPSPGGCQGTPNSKCTSYVLCANLERTGNYCLANP